MKTEKNNSKLIIALSILWPLSLLSAQFCYLLGKTEGFGSALDAMISYTTPSIMLPILIGSWITGQSLTKMQFNIELTKQKFILIAVLCFFFFPIGILFLFGTRNYKRLENHC
jgi:hypothetical protein